MKLLRIFTILFIVLTLVSMVIIWYSRSNNIIPSPMYMFGAIFCPIMALITKGAEIEEREYEIKQTSN